MAGSPPVQRESTPAVLARRLRRAIVAGDLAPGARLGEVDLAERLGVGRGPLREAMQRLTQEGLLVSVPNRGLFVVELTADDVRDIYLARTAVERCAVAEVVRRGGSEPAEALDRVLATMAEAARTGDDERLGELDLQFHEVLVEAAGSARLVRMHRTLVTETRLCLRGLSGTYPEELVRVAEHSAIVEALRGGDADAADRLLVEHMEDGLARLGAAGLFA
ncbi:GntR family transcriptional regulator [Georgenia subflava]|uniref:FCD domain-containing protein n=1 Tax=Georgenia subflava TaxID=1622177 RepID=A0A6N7ERA6_9MICO|nr:GntR family transcriptional regulator [Georgenia subflava]MPV39065.1 FCD domain-containing protein [Georgenia subflava]